MKTRNTRNVTLSLDTLEPRDTPSATMFDGAGHFKADGGVQTTVVFSGSNASERETFSNHPGQVFLADHARRSGPGLSRGSDAGGDVGSLSVGKTVPQTNRDGRVQDSREADTSRSPARQRGGSQHSHTGFIAVQPASFGDFGARGLSDFGLTTDGTSNLKKADPIWAV